MQEYNIYPFQEEIIENKKIRTFSPDVDEEELEWHVDEFDRKIKILEGGGWKIQMNNELPKLLNDGDEIFINKMEWHRAIKGENELIIEIKEIK